MAPKGTRKHCYNPLKMLMITDSKTSPVFKISCYIEAMSNQSTKTASRSAKATRRTDKKTAKGDPLAEIDQEGVEIGAPPGRQGHAAAAAGDPRAEHRAEVVHQVAAKMLRTASPPVQPNAVPEITFKTHKYQVGETVYYTSPTFGRAAATGSYTVVKLLPSEGEDYQYRIKSSGEAFERVAKESQLDRV